MSHYYNTCCSFESLLTDPDWTFICQPLEIIGGTDYLHALIWLWAICCHSLLFWALTYTVALCTKLPLKKKKKWNIAALYCGVSFCCTVNWINIHTHISPFLDFLPIKSPQSPLSRAPQLHSRFLRSRFSSVICLIHSSVEMSIPISQFTPRPAFSPLVIIRFFSTALFLFCFANKIFTIFLDSTYWNHLFTCLFS